MSLAIAGNAGRNGSSQVRMPQPGGPLSPYGYDGHDPQLPSHLKSVASTR